MRPSCRSVRRTSACRARSPHLARTLGLLAEPRLRAGEGVPPAALRPVYLRDADVRVSSAR